MIIKDNAVPDKATMYNALKRRDSHYEGIFFFGVKTTGIFCKPTCRARKPKLENIEFFKTPADASSMGYRPCKICNPFGNSGEIPEWLNSLVEKALQNPGKRMGDSALKTAGLNPVRVRRWFKTNYGTTFQKYLRTLRINDAYNKIKNGKTVIKAAFDSGYESVSGFNESFRKITGFSPGRSASQKIITVMKIETPLGEMIAGSEEEGVCFFEFLDKTNPESQIMKLKKTLRAELLPGTTPHLKKLREEIKEYFNQDRKLFSLPLIIRGTKLQEKAWRALLKIPYGQTRSYREQAKMIGSAKAVRAVANANAVNRIAIIIPCHRVVGSNGKLTGYGGGLWRKKYLLNLERDNS